MYQAINKIGREEIKRFLEDNQQRVCVWDDALDEWCEDAEFQLREGNPPSVEIPHYQSKSGRTEEYTVSDKGVDTLPSWGE